jgi:formate dehydrogenase gamma subunit
MMLGTILSGELGVLVLLLAASEPSQAVDISHRCIECHNQEMIQMLPVEFGDGQEASPYLNREAFLQSDHGHLACDACHLEYHPEFTQNFVPAPPEQLALPTRADYVRTIEKECQRCHGPGGEAPTNEITETLHTPGDGTPTCGDCHPPHTMRNSTDTSVINQRCGGCHEEIYQNLAASVHGASLDEAPNPDVPGCVTCHHAHQAGGKAVAHNQVRLGRPCMGCHGDEQLMRKYDISTSVVGTYLNDFHGVSVKFYGNETHDSQEHALVCADCHGIHGVKPVEEAAVGMQDGLRETCQKCHTDATDNFAGAWLSHTEPSLSSNTLVYLVRTAYWILIPFVITGLVLHILFHVVVLPIRTRLTGNRAARPHPSHSPTPLSGAGSDDIPKHFVRFSLRQRAEHLLVLVTFAILLLTGLPQKFHDLGWAADVVSALGGIETVRWIHRVAGYVLTIAAVLHVITVSASVVIGKAPMTMVPTRKDFQDSVGALRYYLGLADTFPKAGRYDYGQKFEYWGMILGTIVMVVSGFVLIYPTLFAQILPGQLITAARVAHSYEAMMALLTIVVWHMYGARFNPCIFTGKVSSEHLAHHHPLEFERLVRQLRGRRAAPSTTSLRMPTNASVPIANAPESS